MRNLLFYLLILLFGFNSFAQKDSTYTNVQEALKNPNLVYRLNLSGNERKRDLKHIQNFINLEYLDLSFCNLSSFPENILECKQLKYLDISYNSISHLPDEISELTQLEELNIGNNWFRKLPESLGNCRNLRKLDLLSRHQLENLPEHVKVLDSLKYLKCNATEAEFTTIICNLSNLKELVIYTNSPDIICELSGLKELETVKLVLNNVEFIPFECSLKELVNLRKLEIEKNNCCWPYIDVSDDIKISLEALLPEGCELLGFRSNIIRTDIELR